MADNLQTEPYDLGCESADRLLPIASTIATLYTPILNTSYAESQLYRRTFAFVRSDALSTVPYRQAGRAAASGKAHRGT